MKRTHRCGRRKRENHHKEHQSSSALHSALDWTKLFPALARFPFHQHIIHSAVCPHWIPFLIQLTTITKNEEKILLQLFSAADGWALQSSQVLLSYRIAISSECKLKPNNNSKKLRTVLDPPKQQRLDITWNVQSISRALCACPFFALNKPMCAKLVRRLDGHSQHTFDHWSRSRAMRTQGH